MTRPARIPSDINRPDRVVGPFTARQAAILAATAAAVYLLWTVLRELVPPPVFLLGAVPVAAAAVVVALGHRDGLPMDRLLVAAVRHRLSPRALTPDRRVSDRSGWDRSGVSPERAEEIPGWIAARTTVPDDAAVAHDAGPRGRRLAGFPARAVTPAGGPQDGSRGRVGVIGLGPDGLVVIAVVSTVHFALRTPAEQDGLVAGFARYLHALGGPTQILIRALPVDLTGHLQQLHTRTPQLPHPALAAAARGHLTHLIHLAQRRGGDELLTRQVLLVLREPSRPGSRIGSPPAMEPELRAGEQRLLRRLHDAAALLAPLDVTLTVLDAAHTTALLTSTCNPDQHTEPPAGHDDSTRDNVIRRSTRGAVDDVRSRRSHRARSGTLNDNTFDDDSTRRDDDGAEVADNVADWDLCRKNTHGSHEYAVDEWGRNRPRSGDDAVERDDVGDDDMPGGEGWGPEPWRAPQSYRAAVSGPGRRWTR